MPARGRRPRLRDVLRLLSEAHGWAVAEAWVVRPDGATLEMAPVCYARDDAHRPFVDVMLGLVVDRRIGLPGSAWELRTPIVTPDVLEEPRVELQLRRADGEVRWVVATAARVEDEPGSSTSPSASAARTRCATSSGAC